MILISTLIIAKLEPRNDAHYPSFVQFRLRTLLIGVTVFGVLLSLGAYGIAVLITLIMCLILAAVVRALDPKTRRLAKPTPSTTPSA